MRKISYGNINFLKNENSYISFRESRPKARKVTRDKNGHHIMIKELVPQEDVIILNVYSPNNRASKYMRQKVTELKGETDKSTNVVGCLDTSFLGNYRTSRQKISIDTDLNNSTNQLDLTNIYRTFYPTTQEHIHQNCGWNIHQDTPSPGP